MRNARFIIIPFCFLLAFSVFGQKKQDNRELTDIDNISKLEIDSIRESLNIIKIDLSKSSQTVSSSLERLEAEIKHLQDSVAIQSQKLDLLKVRVENPDSNVFRDFIYPIILSILAAILFWIAFSYVPETKRKRKIRVKLDLDIYHVYTNLFSVFDSIMRFNNHSPSDYQRKIRGNKLTKEDIELGLQNKCLNESYLYDPNVNQKLLPTGERLYNISRKIDSTIERIFNFSVYLSVEEILLLEKIRKKLQVYDFESFNNQAGTVIGNTSFYPVNPSLSYMRNNIMELYQYFMELQNVVFDNAFENRDLFLNKVQHKYYSGEFRSCIKTINKKGKNYPNDEQFLNFYLFLCEYESGDRRNAYDRLEKILEGKPHLVSSRGFLSNVLDDEKVEALIRKQFTDKELSELKDIVQREEMHEQAFVDNANGLRDYYKKKAESTKKEKNSA